MSGKVFYASDYNCIDDADISLGSTSFGTDNTTQLQNMLDQALDGPIIIVIDGRFSCTGLTIYSNTHIIGLPGCGLILRDNSNASASAGKNLIKNANIVYTDGSDLGGNIIDENISLINLILNGNSYNTGPTGSNLFDPDEAPTGIGWAQYSAHALKFYGIRNLVVRDCKIYAPRNLSLHALNAEHCYFENIICDHGAGPRREYKGSHGGIRIDGYCRWITWNNVRYFNVQDDCVALNTDNDYVDTNPGIDEDGPIYDCHVQNIQLGGLEEADQYFGYMGVRIQSHANRADRISIRDVKGVIGTYWFTSKHGSKFEGNNGVIQIEDIAVDVIGTNKIIGTQAFMDLSAWHEKIILRNVTRNDFSLNRPYILMDNHGDIGHLLIDGVIFRSSGGSYNGAFIEINGGNIDRLTICNYEHFEENADIDAPLVLLNSGSIGVIHLVGIRLTNINNIIDHQGGTLNRIIASNIYHREVSTPAFKTAGTVDSLILSNFDGGTKTSGTFTATGGDAFP